MAAVLFIMTPGMIPFSRVNRIGAKNYSPKYQRHHLIPLQVYGRSELRPLFHHLEKTGFSIDDFSTNGLLLPCDEREAYISGKPLHCGPHPHYNALVMERMTRISKASMITTDSEDRRWVLPHNIRLFQRTLARALLQSKNSAFQLNNRDPVRAKGNFEKLDACVDILWSKTSGEAD